MAHRADICYSASMELNADGNGPARLGGLGKCVGLETLAAKFTNTREIDDGFGCMKNLQKLEL